MEADLKWTQPGWTWVYCPEPTCRQPVEVVPACKVEGNERDPDGRVLDSEICGECICEVLERVAGP